MDTPNRALVRPCFRMLKAKNIGLMITVLELIETSSWTTSSVGGRSEFSINRGQSLARMNTSAPGHTYGHNQRAAE